MYGRHKYFKNMVSSHRNLDIRKPAQTWRFDEQILRNYLLSLRTWIFRNDFVFSGKYLLWEQMCHRLNEAVISCCLYHTIYGGLGKPQPLFHFLWWKLLTHGVNTNKTARLFFDHIFNILTRIFLSFKS